MLFDSKVYIIVRDKATLWCVIDRYIQNHEFTKLIIIPV